jgi:2-polyprenyl-3-methyl-5-hydroxy-6-metoxy-1,4-benzoquinol methylase
MSNSNWFTTTYNSYWKEFSKKPESNYYERDEVFSRIFNPGEIVLDLACGDGSSSQKIKHITQKEVYGLDLSETAVRLAKNNGINAVQGSVEQTFPFKKNFFDTIFWGDNIEHILNPSFTITEINRVLKPNGRLVISTPNVGYLRYRLHHMFFGDLADSEYNGKKPWEWTHIRFFSDKIIDQFLSENRYEIIHFYGISRRRIDKIFIQFLPKLFGMIMVVVAKKK